jgi:hypothetical protein
MRVLQRFLSWAGAAALAAAALGAARPAAAEEGGSGHYLPGFFGFLAGVLPPERGFYFNDLNYLYTGTFGQQADLPIGGRVVAGFKGTLYANAPTVTWVPGKKLLGATVGTTLAVPLVHVDAAAVVALPGAAGIVRESNFNIGDIYFAPLMLGWNRGDHHVLATAGIYAPTGEYRTGFIAPSGKNFWTVEPTLAYTYLNPKSGLEFSTAFAYDFNSENPATNYLTGQQAHLDWVLAKHFSRKLPAPPAAGGKGGPQPKGGAVPAQGETPPLPEEPKADPGAAAPAAPALPKRLPTGIAAGITGFVYQQVTGDSGAGAVLGPFEGRAYGLGPAIMATVPMGRKEVTLQAKFFREFLVQNRPKGIASYLNIAFKL